MAQSKVSLTDSIQKASDLIYDHPCTTCESDDLNSEASSYCEKCRKLYCDSCVKFHEKFFKDHTVLGKKDKKKWGKVQHDVTMETCGDHMGQDLEMYCRDHDVVCCQTCISVKHRTCKHVDNVLQVAKGIHKKSDFKKLPANVSKERKKLTDTCEARKKNLQDLQDTCKNILSKIDEIRSDLNQLLDEMKKRTIEKMDKLFAILDANVQADIDSCKAINDQLKKLVDDIQGKGKTNETFAFAGFKKCQQNISHAHDLMQSMSAQDYKLVFKPDKQIEQYLSSLEIFGQFEMTPHNSAVPTPRIKTDHAYSIAEKQTASVWVTGDKLGCDITGCCKLPNGNIILNDWRNEKVKLMNENYIIIAHCKLPPKPQDLYHIDNNEVAVSITNAKEYHKIQFIDASNGKLTLTREISLDKLCGGFAYHAGLLYIGSWASLSIYTVAGKFMRQLYEEHPSSLTSKVTKIAVSDGAKAIYVTSISNNHLLTLDAEGQKQAILVDPEMRIPTGVCLADNGNVFVSGCQSHTVALVDGEGKRRISTVATGKDGIDTPKSLWFDRKTSELLVGQQSNNMMILKLK